MNELQKNKFQFNYFSKDYKKFEEDFYRYASINIPLTFLTDDLLHHMVQTKHEYFMLNAKNSKDGRDHYFLFKKILQNDNNEIETFQYIGHRFAS